MPANILEIECLNKSFKSGRKRKNVIIDLTLQVATGNVYGFLGPNGAGKSTTIKIIMNFLCADNGTILIHNEQIQSGQFRYKTGYLPEFPTFYEHLTGHETLLLSGRLSSINKSILKRRIPELLTLMNLQDAINQRVSGYSKGMKQRLGMANALVHDPDLLILDEPMSGLDPLGRNLMKEIILNLKEQGKTVFFSSHILSDIEELCDHIGIIHKGKLIYNGQLDVFLSENKNLEDCFITIIKEHDDTRNS